MHAGAIVTKIFLELCNYAKLKRSTLIGYSKSQDIFNQSECFISS